MTSMTSYACVCVSLFSLLPCFPASLLHAHSPTRSACFQTTVDFVCAGAGKQQHATSQPRVDLGITGPHTQYMFALADGCMMSLSGGSGAMVAKKSIISPNWKFEDMGIGGLDEQFSIMFRRAFASRVLPLEIVEKLGIQHCKGILLYGPPGTGKTLMARKIALMLEGREPKIINGPEVLSKYVGEAEKNIRELFADAEAEYKAKGELR